MNTERRHPMQVFVAGLLTLSGIPILAGGAQPGSLSEALPSPLVYMWATTMVVGGATVVAAAIVKNPITALYLELVADPPLALVLNAYAAGALTVAGWKAIVPFALLVGLSAAFTTRTFTVYRTLRNLRTALGRRE